MHGAELRPREVEQDHIRALLHALEDNLTAVRGEGEVSNIEFGREVVQLPLGSGVHVNQPEILMLNLSAQDKE